MFDDIFTTEHLVIILSKIAIDCLQWRKYVTHNWDKLMRKNSIFLVLAGIHGGPHGEFGEKDGGLLNDYFLNIKRLEKDFKKDIEENNIKIILENVGNHMDSSKLDEEKLICAIKKHNPTILSLAFCYTNVSDLNDVLRSAGIYTTMIMSQDRGNITEGRCVTLDRYQRQFIKGIVDDQPKHIFLWGSSGTGKTLLLAQALSIKLSHYKKQGVKLNVMVTNYFSINESGGQLMKDFKERYLPHLANAEFVKFLTFKKLCSGN